MRGLSVLELRQFHQLLTALTPLLAGPVSHSPEELTVRFASHKKTIRFMTNLYYTLKPLLPRHLQIYVRRKLMKQRRKRFRSTWPIPEFPVRKPAGWEGWPGGKKFALIFGHDVDTAKGRDRCLLLMELERKLGFVSSFNFVPRGYSLPPELRRTLTEAGYEIGVHGLRHDGKLFSSRRVFERRAPQINDYLKLWRAVGFYSPSMFRNMDWISELNIEYGCSTFDTDPFEPQPDNIGTIFPILYHHSAGTHSYVEIPYTMPQDHTVYVIFRERDIAIWTEKLDWIVENGGLVRLNTHPDYMAFNGSRCSSEEYPADYYAQLLAYINTKYAGQFWHGLPRDLARFWRGISAAERK